MAKKKLSPRDIKLVFRPSSALLKCVVLVALLLSVAAVIAMRSAFMDEENEMQTLRQQAVELEQENAVLQNQMDDADSVEGIKHIAQSQLGLVDPNTTFFSPGN